MNYFKYLIVVIVILNFGSFEAQGEDLNNKITKNLRCLICQGQSVYDSDSEFANSLKILIDKKLSEGLNEKQIYDYLKLKYGNWILYNPGFSKKTYLLWLLPLFMFIISGLAVFKLFIKGKN